MKISKLLISLATLPLLAITSSCLPIVGVDFTPRDIHCHGNAWTWEDVEIYTPVIQLEEEDTPVHDVVYFFDIKEERSWWPDRKLGEFQAFFHGGERTPYQILSLNTDYVSQGAPQPSSEGFWLVCTRLCRIKGNVGKEDDGSANIYIVQEGHTTGSGNVYKSDTHRIRCIKENGGGSPPSGGCPPARPFCCWTRPDGSCGECVSSKEHCK